MVLGGLAVLQGVSAVNPAPQVVGQLVSGLGMIGYGLMDLVHAIEMIANGGSNGGSNGGGGGEDGNGHGGNS